MSASPLTVLALVDDPALQAAVDRWLAGQERYRLERCEPGQDPVAELERRGDSIDALLVQQGCLTPVQVQELSDRSLLLPAVVIGVMSGRVDLHEAEVHLPSDQLEQLSYNLDAAVSRFLARGSQGSLGNGAPVGDTALSDRWRLADRLQGRLGLAGVFYKRDPSRFLRNLSPGDASELLQSLQRTYRDYLIQYFRDPAAANQALESFVNTAFFSDLPITKTIEIHIDLIDAFAKQLKLEGHKGGFLQDYRLALLDVLAHLCEMYRRSMPPDLPMQKATSAS
ncbi:circadian clock protein KaiA [Cyanobium sp. CH-040]|uniref:circadian clock protein KaiA n=1 Tax=Cyanobium sp. CH-040 TaxID=2823708 RepID=UPI0020CC61CB|nr:circadian clock protein KaiA [Cyanobium sp. CH-040]